MTINSLQILNRFGQPTGNWAKNIKPSKILKSDSIDDFNKYFEKKVLTNQLQKKPVKDTFTKKTAETGSIPNTF